MSLNSLDLSTVLKKYITVSLNELNLLTDSLSETDLKSAVCLITTAEKNNCRVHVTGIGKPAHAAGYIASLLSSTGTAAYELNAVEAVHGSSGQVLPGDVVIAISNSGETAELQHTVQTLKNNGAKIIAVTGNNSSWLAKQAAISLFAGVHFEGDALNKPPRTSILAEILILQCLSVMLQQEKQLTLSEYVKYHPAGAIGEAIKEIQVKI